MSRHCNAFAYAGLKLFISNLEVDFSQLLHKAYLTALRTVTLLTYLPSNRMFSSNFRKAAEAAVQVGSPNGYRFDD